MGEKENTIRGQFAPVCPRGDAGFADQWTASTRAQEWILQS